MLCKNINVKEGLVNGTRGVVIGFDKSVQGLYTTLSRLVNLEFQSVRDYSEHPCIEYQLNNEL